MPYTYRSNLANLGQTRCFFMSFAVTTVALFVLASPAMTAEPVSVIFDTDMDSDCDDAGALALLHALADRGEVRILATPVSARHPWSGPCVDAINTYFGRPDLPIGIPRATPCKQGSKYAEAIAREFPYFDFMRDHANLTYDAVEVYRRVIAAEPDGSVVLITVGDLTNIRDLLASEADAVSPLQDNVGPAVVADEMGSLMMHLPQVKPDEADDAVDMSVQAEPAFMEPPQIVTTSPGPEYQADHRKFQGIPSLARSPKGRLWAVWYASPSGGEDQNNYIVLITSDDDGKTWSVPSLVIDPDGKGPVRAFDPEVWLDPDGRLWVFWAQAIGHDGSVSGVWAMTTANPDDPRSKWSKPRRLTDGIMMCKPTVLSTGQWILPASTWRNTDHSARAVVSSDHGKTWQVLGGCHVPPAMRQFDEHMIVERKDGSLWMLIRSNTGFLLESFSHDQGKTWTVARPSDIKHPSARFFVRRLASGSLLMIKHHNTTGRNHLTALLSQDDGATWSDGLLLDQRGTISYPDGVQADDGRIFIIYDRNRTSDREILMAVFTEEDIEARKPGEQTRLRVPVNQAEGM